jgi:transketolase
MTVIVPADGIETEQAVRAAAGYKGPVYIRLGRSAVPVIYDDDYKFEIGKASVLREGKDVTVFATGIMVSAALDAADSLAGEGVEVEVINVSTIKPLDAETVVRSLQKTKAGVTAEEHSIIGGLGAAVAELSCENYPVPLVRVGIKDVFGESGTPNELLVKYGLTSEDIVRAVQRVIQRKY